MDGWVGAPRIKICFSGRENLWFNGREHVALNLLEILPLSNINSCGWWEKLPLWWKNYLQMGVSPPLRLIGTVPGVGGRRVDRNWTRKLPLYGRNCRLAGGIPVSGKTGSPDVVMYKMEISTKEIMCLKDSLIQAKRNDNTTLLAPINCIKYQL